MSTTSRAVEAFVACADIHGLWSTCLASEYIHSPMRMTCGLEMSLPSTTLLLSLTHFGYIRQEVHRITPASVKVLVVNLLYGEVVCLVSIVTIWKNAVLCVQNLLGMNSGRTGQSPANPNSDKI